MYCPIYLRNRRFRLYCFTLIYVANFVSHKVTNTVKENLLATPFNNRRNFISKISKILVWLCSYCDQGGRIIYDFLLANWKYCKYITQIIGIVFLFYFIFWSCDWGCVYRVMVRFLTHLSGTFKWNVYDCL